MAPINGAGDDSPRTHARMMLFGLSGRAEGTEGAAVRTLHDLRVEGELGPPLPCRPYQYLANPEAFHAGRAGLRLPRRQGSLRGGADHEELINPPLTDEVLAAVESGGSTRQPTPYRAQQVALYAAIT